MAAARAMSPPGPLRAPAPARDRGARVPRQRPVRARRRLPPGLALAEERDRQRAAARRPGRAPRLRRRRLGRPVQGSCDRGTAPPGGHRRRRPRLELRAQPGLLELALLAGDPAAAPGRGHDRRRRAAACTAPVWSRRRRCPAARSSRTTTENTVTATTDLGFAVTVEDTGDSQEVQIKVTLTIQQSAVADRPDEDDRPDQPGRAEDGRRSATSGRCSSRPGRR